MNDKPSGRELGRKFLLAMRQFVGRHVGAVRKEMADLRQHVHAEMQAKPSADHMQAAIDAAFAKAQTIKGEDGKSVTFEDVRPHLEAWMAKCEAEAERRAQAKVDAAIAVLQERMAQVPSAASVEAMVKAHLAASEVDAERRLQERIERAVASLRQPEDGKDGAAVEDFDISIKDRVLTVSMSIGGQIQRRTVRLPLPHDAGVYKSGQAYEEGAIVTFSGSAFIAQRDAGATEKPEASTAWRLLVKRGRDGKDAE